MSNFGCLSTFIKSTIIDNQLGLNFDVGQANSK